MHGHCAQMHCLRQDYGLIVGAMVSMHSHESCRAHQRQSAAHEVHLFVNPSSWLAMPGNIELFTEHEIHEVRSHHDISTRSSLNL